MAMTHTQAGIPEEWWENFDPPPGFRAEIIQGELVLTPSPGAAHAFAATDLTVALGVSLPKEFGVVQNLEWRLPCGGVVAAAPIPDLMVILRNVLKVVDPPLLAVEILSPSDLASFSDGRTRIGAKRSDYAANGLKHYLEVDLLTPRAKSVTRFEMVDGVVIRMEEAIGDEVLVAKLPFPYEICPNDL